MWNPPVPTSGVKAYMSGIEVKHHFNQCVLAKVIHVLCSYWYLRDKDPKMVRRRKKQHPEMQFMVDSGAHTFITDFGKFMQWTRKNFDDYVEAYVKWIVDNQKYISVAIEFDIDRTLNMALTGNPNSTLGSSIVASWQKDLFMPLQKKGIDIIYVWHEQRGMEGWEEMCAKFDYVGLPGHYSSKPDFNKFLAVARRYTTRLHGMAATKQSDYRDHPWFSFDSITWKTGEMYGLLIDWDAQKQEFKFITDKADRPRFRQKLTSLGFNADAIINDTDYMEVTRYAMYSMRQMEAFYQQRFADRLFYYQLRLPHHAVLTTYSAKHLVQFWGFFRPETLFKQHVGISSERILVALQALSSVQRGDAAYIDSNAGVKGFLRAYFPKLVDPLPTDMGILQRELSVYISPPNPPPLSRSAPEHYELNVNAPKARKADWDLEDLDLDISQNSSLAQSVMEGL